MREGRAVTKARILNALAHERYLRAAAAKMAMWVLTLRSLADSDELSPARAASLRLTLHRRSRLIVEVKHARRCLQTARARGVTRRPGLSRMALKLRLSEGHLPGLAAASR